MDLALEMGRTVDELTHAMRERELVRWSRYARQRQMPTRRIEYALARVAQVVAVVMGGSTSPLGDFMVEYVPPKKARVKPKTAEAGAAIGMIAGRGVYKLGQKRRR